MKHEIIISGFGGQGIMFAGTLLCHAGLREGKFVTFFPSYGAEIRGGTANCQIIIATASIGSPIVYHPDILLSLNKPSYEKFSPRVKKGGTILVNSSLYKPQKNNRATIIEIPANNLAEKCGSSLFANMVMLGALVSFTKILTADSLSDSIPIVLGEKKKNLWVGNQQAVTAGFSYITSSKT